MASRPAVRTRTPRAGALRARVGAVVVALVVGAGCTAGEGADSGAGGSPAADRPTAEDVVAAVTEEGLGARLGELAAATGDSDGYRSVGSEGYARAAALVEGRLVAAGWSVTSSTLDAPAVLDDGSSSLRVAGRSFGVDDLRPLLLSPAGDVTGPVVAVNGAPGSARSPGVGCSAGDYGRLPAGAVVVVPPGGCFRRDQLLAAQEAGAAAFVTYSPGAPDGMVLRPTLASADGLEIPGAWVSSEAAAALGDAATAAGGARLVLTARTEMRPTRSVVGELRGSGGEVVVLGAHLDSVVDGPGANDDGSGVAALLEIVRAIGSSGRRASVRVVFWAGEEVGLLGSSRYVGGLSDAEREAIVLYANADMVASPNGFAGVYDEPSAALGSDAARDLLRDAVGRAGGAPVSVDLHGSSDHHPFAVAGIPTAGVFSGAVEQVTPEQAAASGATAGLPADACYHQACDDVDNVDLALARLLTAALADVAVRVADDPGLLTR